MHGSFSEDGFLVIRNAIGNELLGEIYLEIFNCLSGPAHSEASCTPDDIYELFVKSDQLIRIGIRIQRRYGIGYLTGVSRKAS